jgi:eukaryotic-like serine/threonine-protein kinase
MLRRLTSPRRIAPSPPSADARLAGLPARLGRYEVRAKIADGGMATVFVAQIARASSDPRHGQDAPESELVAIKMIRDEFARSSEFLTMFMDEAKIVSRLRHPNIVRYHELGQDDGQVFIAMELLSGQSLWSVWDACRARGTRVPYEIAAYIAARVAEGLHYAHELVDENGDRLEIVHRDVNATNIFVTYEGEVKVIDFGLAKAANRASKTAAGIIKGKVAYMSPEQAVGAPVDRGTDVFALGTTLWEIVCDRRLFKHADEVETLRRVHAADVPDPTRLVPGFPPSLWRALERALERDRSMRYQTAAELARDLDGFVREGRRGVDRAAVAAMMGELFPEGVSGDPGWDPDETLREGGPPAPGSGPSGQEDTTMLSARVLRAPAEMGSTPGRRRGESMARPSVFSIASLVFLAAAIAFALWLR